MASTKPNAWILDPFAGSSTTGIAANLLGRRFLGIEKERNYAELSKARRQEIEDMKLFKQYKRKIPDINQYDVRNPLPLGFVSEEVFDDLPF